MRHWLLKTEPGSYSIDDLKREKRTAWSGVRNYQARNFMREMRLGDPVLISHSNTAPAGLAGIGKVVALAHPDATQFEKNGPYFEPRATAARPVWACADVGFARKFKRFLSLEELRGVRTLKDMELLRRGSRLSVQPVTKKEFEAILRLAGFDDPAAA